ncbi:MAG: tRNA lysidine(34) synthetase TilS [Ruminococcaceae bacterium]|nr:tRNA lysidine(34) synthetase TilS [Oscillospiraceae bacterium]
MLNKLLAAIRRYDMVRPGDTVICAVSGGADSMALLWGMWLLKEKLEIRVEAAHFDHNLRGEESTRDAEFVEKFCDFHDIPLHLGRGNVVPGKKGLEAAARNARYSFLRSLDGTIATAHTADDNAETVLLHLLRGSGLRGLGGVTPKSDRLIRPMLDVTRAQVEEFLNENYIRHMEDSSNDTDAFLRNRLRHHVMPLLKQENPSIALGLSAAAQRIRQDALLLDELAAEIDPTDVPALRAAPGPLRRRAIEGFLKQNGFPEPSAEHIKQAEAVVFSDNPSARVTLSGLTLRRSYDRLCADREQIVLPARPLPYEGLTRLPEIGIAIRTTIVDAPGEGVICPAGEMVVRCRQSGDTLTTSGGTKSLKKRFIDRKLPQWERLAVPVIADETGVLAVMGFGTDVTRREGGRYVRIEFVSISNTAEE